MSIRENLLSKKPKVISVDIDGDEIFLKTWSGVERAKFSEFCERDKARAYAYVVLLSVSDADGNLQFTEEDLEKLHQSDGTIIRQIADAALRVNHLDEQSINEAKKNLLKITN